MKKYYLDELVKPGMSIEVIDAINYGVEEDIIEEFITDYFGIKRIETTDMNLISRQIEIIEMIKDSFFTAEEVEEEEDTWEYDRMEREREYRLMQGF